MRIECQKNELMGFLLINKPVGISSFDVIRKLRKQTNIKKFGHTGTLDPFASGLLIIAVNKCTKLISLFESMKKKYFVTMEFGKETSTGDPEGHIIRVINKKVEERYIKALPDFVLNIKSLTVPIFSAIKIDGQRAYKKARLGAKMNMPVRNVTIYDFSIIDYFYPYLTYSCTVSKGTYIRSLSQAIASFCDNIAYTSSLCRLAIEHITLEKAIVPEIINENNISKYLLNIRELMPNNEVIVLYNEESQLFLNGRKIFTVGPEQDSIIVLDSNQNCLGLGYRKNNWLSPLRVIR